MSPRRALPWLIAWAVVVVAVAARHELFRDEVRAIDIVAASDSLRALVHNLRNEGHPILWYLVLFAGFHATGTMLVLKPAAFAIAAGAVWIWLRRAPFQGWQKVVFLFGTLPLYEYSVMCRNYGISMLLLFAIASVGRRRPLVLGVLLALLANTNASSFILTGALAIVFAGELYWRDPRASRCAPWKIAAALATVIVGLAAAAAVMYPDTTTVATGMHQLAMTDVARSFAHAVIAPTGCFARQLGAAEYAIRVVFALFLVHLASRPHLAIAVLLAGIGLTMLDDLIYPMSYRHTGLLLVFALTVLWIDRDGAPRAIALPEPIARLAALLDRRGAILLGAVLASQVITGLPDVIGDFTGARSTVPALAGYLADHGLADAIVIAEPDAFVEALPYYADNPIYLPREHRYFAVRIDFTSASDRVLTLDELMQVADELHASTGKPVVIALAPDVAALPDAAPYAISYGYGHELRSTPAALARFRARWVELVRLDDAANENFVVFGAR